MRRASAVSNLTKSRSYWADNARRVTPASYMVAKPGNGCDWFGVFHTESPARYRLFAPRSKFVDTPPYRNRTLNSAKLHFQLLLRHLVLPHLVYFAGAYGRVTTILYLAGFYMTVGSLNTHKHRYLV